MAKQQGKGPWWHKGRKQFCAWINGKLTNLGKNEKKATAEWVRLSEGEVGNGANTLVVNLIDAFLKWSQKHDKPRTTETHVRFLKGTPRKDGSRTPGSFAEHVGNMQVGELTEDDVTEWIAERYGDVSPNTQAGAIRSVKRVFSWASQNPTIKKRKRAPKKLIDTNPVADVEVPKFIPKKVWITDEQWNTIVSQFDESDPFRDVLEFVRETGARPQEVWRAEARHLWREVGTHGGFRFPKSESKGESPRQIWFTPRAREIVERLIEKYPTGKLFRNNAGRPWDNGTLSKRLVRLKDTMRAHLTGTRKNGKPVKNRRKFPGFDSLEAIDKISLYAGRKSYITKAIKNGVSPIVLRHLAGHQTLHMINKVYGAVEQDDELMGSGAEQAVNGKRDN